MQKQFQKYLTFILILTLSITAVGSVSAAPSQQEIDCAETYTVQANDWLSKIAEKYYGDSLEYDTIVAATNALAESDSTYTSIDNPNVIEIGWNLCIPSLTKEGEPIILEQADEAVGDEEAMTEEMVEESHPPSPTPLPAGETPTPIPIDTPTPELLTATATSSPTAVSQVQANRAVNVRAGPGTNYAIVGGLNAGDTQRITGRNADSSWWQIEYNGTSAWVAASVVANTDTANTPIVAAPALPEPRATPIPLATNTPLPPATPIPLATNTPAPSTCRCDSNVYNCSQEDFSSQEDAQACYDFCLKEVGQDIHDLDRNNDRQACDSGLN